MRAHAYARCSTAEQATSALGLEAQKATIATEAMRLGAELVAVHVDAGFSGSLPIDERPGLLEAVHELRRGDVLLVAKRDRLGRDVVAVALVERLVARKGARIVSAAGEGTENDDPTSLLMRRLLDSFAEYERLLIGARTKAALKAKRRRGERAGATPYGYSLATDGKSLIPEPREQAILAWILEHRAQGIPLRALAAQLNEQGVPARRGGRWSHSSIISLLKTAARHAA